MEQFDILTMGDIKLYNFAQDNDINIKNTFITIFKELYEPLINNDYFLYENDHVQIQKNDIVVDCGGNFGLFMIWAATNGAHVYSFEPSKTNIQYLLKMAHLYSNVTVEQKALGNKSDIVQFTDCYFSGGSHLSQFDLNESCIIKNQYAVQMISLDEYFGESKIDFIKIDAEGAELLVLQGAKNILKNKAPKLAIACYHENENFSMIESFIHSININYHFEKKGDILFAWSN